MTQRSTAPPGQFQTYPEYGNSTDLWDQYDEFNTNAIKSDAYAFMFDQTPVRNEYTALNNVYQQYQKSIEFGAVDPRPRPRGDEGGAGFRRVPEVPGRKTGPVHRLEGSKRQRVTFSEKNGAQGFPGRHSVCRKNLF